MYIINTDNNCIKDIEVISRMKFDKLR